MKEPEADRSHAIPSEMRNEGFISDCIKVLNTATVGTAIYILSRLCPQDFNFIMEVVHVDLSKPHHHEHPRKKIKRAALSSYEDIISHHQAYLKTRPEDVYLHTWR